jgi:signal transduction histidine kinase
MLGGVAIAAALLIAGFGIVNLFERHVERRAEAELDTYIRQIAAGISFNSEGDASFTRPLPDPRFGEPLSGLYWQVEDDSKGRVLRSRSLWDSVLKLPSDNLPISGVHRHRLEGPSGSHLLLRERRIVYPAPNGERTLRIATALDEREIHATRAEFSMDLLKALVLLGVSLFAAAWLQIGIGLKPLKMLRQSILAVRSGAKRRVEAEGPEEVMPLVEALNSLLDGKVQAVDRAKARAADLAHGIKTPLTVLLSDARKLREEGAHEMADEIEELAQRMGRIVERELSQSRLQGLDPRQAPRTPVEPVLAKLVRALARTPKGEGLTWQVDAYENIQAPMREEDLAELLGNLLDNACKWAESSVAVSASVRDGVSITIKDDGPGVPPSSIGQLGERGLRLDLQVPGSGIGLAIAQDIARAYGASVTFGSLEPHGFEVTVAFPAQTSASSDFLQADVVNFLQRAAE